MKAMFTSRYAYALDEIHLGVQEGEQRGPFLFLRE